MKLNCLKSAVLILAMAAALPPSAEAFFRGGGFHYGGGGAWHAGGIGPAGNAWHAGGVHGDWGGTWHADGWHAGGWYGGGYHGPVVVNHYYGGGCWACGGAAVAAGVAAGAAAGYAMGTMVATLPPGCIMQYANGINYSVCSGTWFRPYYGNNGLYYRVVPPL
jgi:hypothetical protein